MSTCGWCGRPIEWTESFAAVAPPRWVHCISGSENCYGLASGVRWARPGPIINRVRADSLYALDLALEEAGENEYASVISRRDWV